MSSCGKGTSIRSCFSFSSISIKSELRKLPKFSIFVHVISVRLIPEPAKLVQRTDGAGSSSVKGLFFATANRTCSVFLRSVP